MAAASGEAYVTPPALATASGSGTRRLAGRWVDSAGAALALGTIARGALTCLRASDAAVLPAGAALCPAAGAPSRWVGFDPTAVAVVDATLAGDALRVRDARGLTRTFRRAR